MTNATQIPMNDVDWRQSNATYLDLQLRRLRLLLELYKLWLRSRWNGPECQVDALDAIVIREEAVDRCGNSVSWEERNAFYQADRSAREVGQSLLQLEMELEARSQAMAAEGKPASLDLLCTYFDLNEFERAVVLLCAAPEIDPSFSRIYAYLQDDAGTRHPSPGLALALFCPDAERAQVARQSFLPTSSLRRYGIITLSAGLRTDERIVSYLHGYNECDARIAELLRPLPTSARLASHQAAAELLEGWLRNPAARRRWHGVNLFGPQGSGRRALARILCDRLGLNLFRLDPAALPPPGMDRQNLLRLLAREAILAQIAVYIDAGAGETDSDPNGIDDLIERMPTFFVAASRSRLSTSRPLISLALKKIDAEGRRQLWLNALFSAGISLPDGIDQLVEQFEFSPDMVVQAVKAARVRARLRNHAAAGSVTAEDLWDACREQTSWKLAQLARPVTPLYVWDDIVLGDAAVRQLREIADQATYRSRVYQDWGFGKKLARGRGISALFAGVSGTGKTMAAEVLANHLKLDLYRIDLAGVVSKYIGETEKNLRKIFDAAERSGAILFFDEADALFGRRTDVKDSHDRFANIEVNYLLQRMEDYRGLSILATNRKNEVDRAFLRRLRFLVDFPFPDQGQRLLIWQKVFPPQTPLGDIDFEFLSRMELAGGNIRNIALAAAFLAAEEGERVEMSHLVHASRREYAKIDKMVSEPDFSRQNTQVVRN